MACLEPLRQSKWRGWWLWRLGGRRRRPPCLRCRGHCQRSRLRWWSWWRLWYSWWRLWWLRHSCLRWRLFWPWWELRRGWVMASCSEHWKSCRLGNARRAPTSGADQRRSTGFDWAKPSCPLPLRTHTYIHVHAVPHENSHKAGHWCGVANPCNCSRFRVGGWRRYWTCGTACRTASGTPTRRSWRSRRCAGVSAVCGAPQSPALSAARAACAPGRGSPWTARLRILRPIRAP